MREVTRSDNTFRWKRRRARATPSETAVALQDAKREVAYAKEALLANIEQLLRREVAYELAQLRGSVGTRQWCAGP